MKNTIDCRFNVSTLTHIYTLSEVKALVSFIRDQSFFDFRYFHIGNPSRMRIFQNIGLFSWDVINVVELFKWRIALYFEQNEERSFHLGLWDRFDKSGNYTNPFPRQGIRGCIYLEPWIEDEVINFFKRFIIKAKSSFYYLMANELWEKIDKERAEKGKIFYLDIFKWAYFLTYIRPTFVPVLWKQNLLDAPAYNVEELENGGIFIQSTKSIFDYHNGSEQEIDKKLEELEVLDDYILSLYPDNDTRLKILDEEERKIKDQHLTLDYLMNN